MFLFNFQFFFQASMVTQFSGEMFRDDNSSSSNLSPQKKIAEPHKGMSWGHFFSDLLRILPNARRFSLDSFDI